MSSTPNLNSKSGDVEKAGKDTSPTIDIEHVLVADDPRNWSKTYKWILVAILSIGALSTTMAASIFFPAIDQVQSDLHTTSALISLSISLYILVQGICPIFWSPVAELVGRKPCLIAAMIIFVVSMVITSRAPNMAVLIIFRVIGAIGASATQSIASGSLADTFDPIERGQVIGIYYGLPALGPALSPVLGGALTEAGTWRACFYFSAASGFLSLISYALMRETFRTERSAAWQAARLKAIARAEASLKEFELKEEKEEPRLTARDTREEVQQPPAKNLQAISNTAFVSPRYHSPGIDTIQSYIDEFSNPLQRAKTVGEVLDADGKRERDELGLELRPARTSPEGRGSDLKRNIDLGPFLSRTKSIKRTVTAGGEEIKVSPTLMDLSPLGSAWMVVRLPHNLLALLFSGLIFASQYSLSYTAARTFARAPYSLSPVLVGAILLAFGGGGVIGSFVGGKMSDKRLERLKAQNGDSKPLVVEERLKAVFWAVAVMPACFIVYGWTVYFKVHIAAPIVALFFLGLSQIAMYSVTLSYLIDANPGRSLGTAALNSLFRGVLAFVSSEIAAPLQDGIGDGALYSGWAVVLLVGGLSMVWVSYRGMNWREKSLRRAEREKGDSQ